MMALPRVAFPRVAWTGLAVALLIALVGRVLLLMSGSVSFHSDEAVVALMARHILEGERPIFFYGQAYMGSLDAWIVAVSFALGGESVLSIRLAQSALYLGIVAVGYGAAWRMTGRVSAALMTALMLAIPPVLLALYTTATLGGYNETLLLGGLVWWLAYDVTHEYRRSIWRWGLMGLCAGLGWWTNALIVTYAAPAALLILWSMWRDRRDLGIYAIGIGAALAGFIIGALPWIMFNLQNDFAGLSFLLGSRSDPDFAGTDVFSLPIEQRLIGLFLLGLPTLIGLRFPWTPEFFLAPVGVIVLAAFALALIGLARSRQPSRGYILGTIGLFCAVYFASRFSFDPTGRYFLPLSLPVYIAFAGAIARLPSRLVKAAVMALTLGYFAAGQISAATSPPGLTTQFNLDTHLPNDDDAALIAFLDENELYNGYTNYWISFRLAFLSAERMQYSATLPYKPDLTYTPLDERYPPFRAAADSAERIAYITARLLSVDARLEAILAERGVTYRQAQVGIYRVYYDFEPAVPRPPLPFLR
jgi:4-amino-4-deoxy-L-arabinose transferase-like glycosyltransferase